MSGRLIGGDIHVGAGGIVQEDEDRRETESR